MADDWNGPTYDVALNPRSSSIMPPTKFLQSRMAAQMAFDKGQLDLRYGFDTPEAALFAERGRTASAAEQGDDVNAGQENGGRNHGTACASEIADGAPYVRLYNHAALPWGQGEDKRPLAYDEAVVARWAAAIDRAGPRMRGAGVRVVSMSWGLTTDDITEQLLDLGFESDQAKAKARGIAMQKTIGTALENLVRSSPNILFIVAAGNSNQADDVQADVTEKFSLPNLNAHRRRRGTNGRPTAFTVFGKSVDLYAQGEAVKLRWPGDITLHESRHLDGRTPGRTRRGTNARGQADANGSTSPRRVIGQRVERRPGAEVAASQGRRSLGRRGNRLPCQFTKATSANAPMMDVGFHAIFG